MSGALFPSKVGCEPGVSKLGTLQIFSRVCDPSFMTPMSGLRAQSRRESPLESSGWKESHRGLWALKSPRTSESGEDGSEGKSMVDWRVWDRDGGQYMLHITTHLLFPNRIRKVEVSEPSRLVSLILSKTNELLM